jgi:phosphomannomutase/phosphoglucomutase
MNPHIFREYDIRGLVGEDLDLDTVRALGRGYGSAIAERGGRVVAVGMDVRESSPSLAAAIIGGIISAGVDVRALGVVPTPAVYFAVHHDGLDGAVQITGSHNPIEFNGFKMMKGTGSFFGEDIQALRRRMEAADFRSGAGRVEDRDIRGEYLEAMESRLSLARPLKVVLDAGNGCAGPFAPELFRRLGAEVEELYCEPDGRFPNHMPDPTLPETLVGLRERVLTSGADIGLAYDGDADRLGALDERGRVLWGDQLLALFARQVLARHPGAPILFEVKCSRALIEDIEAHGGRPVMTRTGHSIIKTRMKETGSPLAGEMSGHMFFADDWYGFDDAIYASGRLAQLVASSPRTLGALADELPRYHATPEIRVDCPDESKFDVVEAIRARYRGTHEVIEVDGARVNFPDGWGLVRASNTQPVLVLRAEGTTAGARDAIEAELRGALRELGVGPTASR